MSFLSGSKENAHPVGSMWSLLLLSFPSFSVVSQILPPKRGFSFPFTFSTPRSPLLSGSLTLQGGWLDAEVNTLLSFLPPLQGRKVLLVPSRDFAGRLGPVGLMFSIPLMFFFLLIFRFPFVPRLMLNRPVFVFGFKNSTGRVDIVEHPVSTDALRDVLSVVFHLHDKLIHRTGFTELKLLSRRAVFFQD